MHNLRFDKILPSENLKSYIRYYVISENLAENTYKVFPSTGLVMGFQYHGSLSHMLGTTENRLATAGITGISDTYTVFKNSAFTGTILVYFTETGLAQFTSCPANEIFNQSVPLDNIFDRKQICEIEERLALAKTDRQRIDIIDTFLISQLRQIQEDRLVMEAVRLIYESNGGVKIKELNGRLFISQSPFEKRFRNRVGCSPKKFASIVRFNTVLNQLGSSKSLTEICYENNFFDQAHFIKDFKTCTGITPDAFRHFI